MAEQFSISKDSIQIPYSRFLADSAAGLMGIVAAIAVAYLPIVSSKPLRVLILATPHPGVGSEVKVFVLIALFLLATPLGFAVNAVSWLTLSQVIARIEMACFKRTDTASIFAIWYVSVARHSLELASELSIDATSFPQSLWLLRDAMESPGLVRYNRESQVRGLVIFLRNGALFSAVGAFTALYFALAGSWPRAVLALGAVASAIILLARWDSPAPVRHGIRAAGVAALTCLLVAVYIAWPSALAVRAVGFFSLAVILVAIAGVIGYYNYCAVLVNVHLAAAALGVTLVGCDGERETILQFIKRLTQRAGELTRKDAALDPA